MLDHRFIEAITSLIISKNTYRFGSVIHTQYIGFRILEFLHKSCNSIIISSSRKRYSSLTYSFQIFVERSGQRCSDDRRIRMIIKILIFQFSFNPVHQRSKGIETTIDQHPVTIGFLSSSSCTICFLILFRHIFSFHQYLRCIIMRITSLILSVFKTIFTFRSS